MNDKQRTLVIFMQFSGGIFLLLLLYVFVPSHDGEGFNIGPGIYLMISFFVFVVSVVMYLVGRVGAITRKEDVYRGKITKTEIAVGIVATLIIIVAVFNLFFSNTL